VYAIIKEWIRHHRTHLITQLLTDPRRRISGTEFPRTKDQVDLPGVYCWCVDKEGAFQLTSGLKLSVSTGLVYAGQAGAGSSADEAEWIGTKCLLTLQEGVSENQFAQMEKAGIVLVVPQPLFKKYPESVRDRLVNFEWFIGEVSELASSLVR